MTEAAEGRGDMPDTFANLLSVQDHDTAIDQLRHRRAALLQRGELGGVEATLGELEVRSADLTAQRDELAGRQAGLEEQIGSARKRRAELEQRMYSGSVSAARDLQAMDDEVRHLARHVAELEDREIEVMEALEPVDGDLQAVGEQHIGLDGTAQRLRAEIAEAESGIDAELAVEMRARAEAAGGVPKDLLATYERLRAKLGGTGAARLVGSSCGGCHLALPAMEIDRIRKAPPDAVVTCEQCGRILVR
jgi:predicted  nucleic acid-binding Zn-ribbon protein